MRASLSVSLLLLFLASSLIASQSQSTGTLRGYVLDNETRQIVPWSSVGVLGTDRGAVSDENGFFELTLPAGTYSLIVSHLGYVTTRESVTLVSGETTNLKLKLVPAAYLLQGVTVYQSQTAAAADETVSSVAVKSDDVVRMPGTLKDVYRSIKTLPGVTSNNGMSSEFNVRGGTFDENLVIVNDAQVYRPFHIKEAPNGSVSIFNMDMLEKVELITGGFTARYGDKMSSVMNIEYREGADDRLHSQFEIGMLGAVAVLEGPVYKGSWILGLRKSYLQYILDVMEVKKSVSIDFYDVQGQVTQHLGPGTKLGIQFIHSGDSYADDPGTEDEVKDGFLYDTYYSHYERHDYDKEDGNYANNLLSLALSKQIRSTTLLKTVLSHYHEYEWETNNEYEREYSNVRLEPDGRLYYDFENYEEHEHTRLTIRTTELKQEALTKLHPNHELRVGLNYQLIEYDTEDSEHRLYSWGSNYPAYPDTMMETFTEDRESNLHPTSFKTAAYFEDTWNLRAGMLLNLGLRTDYFDFNRDWTISPRVNLSQMTPCGAILRGAWGIYYQSPTHNELRYDYATSHNTQSQRAIHYVLGLEWPVSSHVKIKAEPYYKQFTDLISFESTQMHREYSRINDSEGYAAGLDLFLQGNWNRCSGWISYGYLKAREDSLGDSRGEFPRSSDQTHTLAVVGDVNLGKQWSLRLKALYGSGFPYTPDYIVETQAGVWERVHAQKHSGRLPAYQRVDVRIGRRMQWSRFTLDGFFELVNVFGHENVFAYDWDYDNGHWDRETITLLPFMPNLGVSLQF